MIRTTLRSVVTAGLTAVLLGVAQAGVLHNGWNYAIDAVGGAEDGSGGINYFDRGMAFSMDATNVYFAISSQMALGGSPDSAARNGSQAHGELFINFSGHDLKSDGKFHASDVYAVRFDGNNDSLGNTADHPNHQLGVYNNVRVVNLTGVNRGYATLQAYINAGFGRTTNAMADLEDSAGDVAAYLDLDEQYPNIREGDYLGGITLLGEEDLSLLGLDFNHFADANPAGNHIYGFSFSRTLLPVGTFTAHVYQECINDGMALKGTTVPEPTTIGALIAGLTALIRRRKTN